LGNSRFSLIKQTNLNVDMMIKLVMHCSYTEGQVGFFKIKRCNLTSQSKTWSLTLLAFKRYMPSTVTSGLSKSILLCVIVSISLPRYVSTHVLHFE